MHNLFLWITDDMLRLSSFFMLRLLSFFEWSSWLIAGGNYSVVVSHHVSCTWCVIVNDNVLSKTAIFPDLSCDSGHGFRHVQGWHVVVGCHTPHQCVSSCITALTIFLVACLRVSCICLHWADFDHCTLRSNLIPDANFGYSVVLLLLGALAFIAASIWLIQMVYNSLRSICGSFFTLLGCQIYRILRITAV